MYLHHALLLAAPPSTIAATSSSSSAFSPPYNLPSSSPSSSLILPPLSPLSYHVMASSLIADREDQICSGLFDHTHFVSGLFDRPQGFPRDLEAHFEQNCDILPGRKTKRFRHSFGRQPGHAVCFRDGSPRLASSPPETSVSCTTFNILAPIYKRIDSEGCRESQFPETWLNRNQGILDMLLYKGSSIICLQEFWLGNDELVRLYEDNLGDAGYIMYKLARTNNRGDGLLTAIRSDRMKVLDYQERPFNDWADRVAQFFHLQSRMPYHKRGQNAGTQQELLLVNTHLLFPHNSSFCLIRLRQVYKIIEYLEHYKMEQKLPPIPIILCGDWNGSKRGHVYKFLRSQGFVSSYDTAHSYTDTDVQRWVSHRNHRGNVCGVDFIWLLNPSRYQKTLSTSWKEAVFGIIKAKLQEAGLRGRDAFCFFKSQQKNGDHVTLSEFHLALHQLGLTEQYPEGLTREEIEDLMQTVDIDGNGFIDYDEFQVAFTLEAVESKHRETSISEENNVLPTLMKSRDHTRPTGPLWDASNAIPTSIVGNASQGKSDLIELCEAKGEAPQRQVEIYPSDAGTGFDVQDAFLFPPEVEKGCWPENYSLSDHAPLTAIFTPVRVSRGQPTLN